MMEDQFSSHEEPVKPAGKKRNLPLIILIVLLVCSGMLNLFFFIAVISAAAAGPGSSDALVESLVEGDSQAENSILLLRVEGVIVRESGSRRHDPVAYVQKRLKRASDEENGISGVVLLVNSPGGGVTESDEIHRAIVDFKEKTGKPVVAFFQNVAASGGYYISASCDEIIAQPTSITGSIGVIMSLMNVKGLMDKAGIESNVIVSERTPFKDIGSPFREMKEEERAHLRSMVDEMYDRFVTVVTDGRKDLSRDQVIQAATGMIYTGEEAVKLKLADRTGYFKDAVKTACSLARTPGAKVIEYERRPGLIESILAAKAPEISIVPIPVRNIIRNNTGLPMYLWIPGASN